MKIYIYIYIFFHDVIGHLPMAYEKKHISVCTEFLPNGQRLRSYLQKMQFRRLNST